MSLYFTLKRLNRFRKNFPIIPVLIVSSLAIIGIIGPYIAPHSPIAGSLKNSLRPPFWVEGGSKEFPLGTDKMGRDIFSRMLAGARTSLLVSVIAIFFAGFVGTSLGLISGYMGSWLDGAIMRLTDIALSLPLILLALMLAYVLGPGFWNVVLVLILVLWARYARQIRAEVLSIKSMDFVALAKISGCSPARIMIRHIFPNVAPTLLVLITLQVGWVILLEASLSFLGVGLAPPEPAWGLMVADGRDYIASAWWISMFPGLAIVITVLGFNFLGDWLRDRFDPKMQQL